MHVTKSTTMMCSGGLCTCEMKVFAAEQQSAVGVGTLEDCSMALIWSSVALAGRAVATCSMQSHALSSLQMGRVLRLISWEGTHAQGGELRRALGPEQGELAGTCCSRTHYEGK
jgi:hypothetical protein